MSEIQGYVFHCLHNKREIGLVGEKDIGTGMSTIGHVFSLLIVEV